MVDIWNSITNIWFHKNPGRGVSLVDIWNCKISKGHFFGRGVFFGMTHPAPFTLGWTQLRLMMLLRNFFVKFIVNIKELFVVKKRGKTCSDLGVFLLKNSAIAPK